MDTQTQVETAAPAPAPELSINDLQQIRAIVDLAARRGAFQGAELSTVGSVFDRLNTFLNAVAPPVAADAPTADAPTATTDDSATPAA